MVKNLGKNRTVLIAGGGIGGLAAAASLGKMGFRVHVLEQADDFREVGAGIQIAPNGVRALTELGFRTGVDNYAWRPPALVMRDAATAKDIVNISLGDEFKQRFDEPYMVIHRADLLEILLEACRKDPNVTLDTHSRVVAIEQDDNEVRVRLENDRELAGDALIGADGLRSIVRQTIIHDGSPVTPKYVVYRGVIDRRDVPEDLWEPEVVMWTGPDADFVHYPVRRGELFNLVVTFKAAEELDPADIQGSREDMTTPYASFHSNVHRLLDLLGAERRWMVTDRTPVKGWTQGRITLLGDAAHPMLQYMAQGACQAAEDVAQLIQEIKANPDNLMEAFTMYSDKRYQRTARVQFSARQMIELCQVKGLLADVRANYFGNRSQDQLYDGLAWLYSAKENEMFV